MKIHIISSTVDIEDSEAAFIETGCGKGYMIRCPKKHLSKNHKEVTCGNCKRTRIYFEERNKNE